MGSDRFVKIGFAGAVVLLVALGIFAGQNIWRLGRTAQLRSETWSFLARAERTLSLLKDMERNQRAYLLTGDEKHLKAYHGGAILLAPKIDELRAGTFTLPDQLDPLARVAGLARQKKEELDAGIFLRRERGYGSSLPVALIAGEGPMGEINFLMEKLDKRVAEDISARTNTIHSVVERTILVSVVSTVLAVCLFGLALFCLQKLSRDYQRVTKESFAFRKENTALQAKLAAAVEGQNLVVKALQENERALAESRRRAYSATRAKSEFLANMSHEIRTPLNGILGMTAIMLDSKLSAEQLDYAKTIQRSGESLLGLLNDILDFSKVEAGKVDFETVDFDIGASLRDLLKSFQYAVKRKGIALNAEIPEGARFFKGDPGRIRQVLVNLVGNAVKFTEKGSVTLRLRLVPLETGDTLVRFEVQDTGIGIEERTVPHLFRAFSQGDASTTRRFGGTGLGLFISKRLVEAMGGEIGLTSVKDSGSTFWFELKLKPGERRLGGESKAEIRPVKGRYRILVAEDNEVNQKIVLKMLEKMGLRAECVVNGAEAIDTLRKRSYDLILMDCQMPVMDGYEATARIRTDRVVGNNDIPIIAMTANAMKGDRELCLASGMNDYLAKPLSLKVLSEALEKWILEVDGRKKQAFAGAE